MSEMSKDWTCNLSMHRKETLCRQTYQIPGSTQSKDSEETPRGYKGRNPTGIEKVSQSFSQRCVIMILSAMEMSRCRGQESNQGKLMSSDSATSRVNRLFFRY